MECSRGEEVASLSGNFISETYTQAQYAFILETMVNKNILDILPKMGFEHFDYVEPVNHSGGLAVLWNNGTICASILKKRTESRSYASS